MSNTIFPIYDVISVSIIKGYLEATFNLYNILHPFAIIHFGL